MRKLMILILVVICCACSNTKSDSTTATPLISEQKTAHSIPFPLIKWNHHIYRITTENVTDIELEIGEIEYQSMNEERETPDNFSTSYPAGTKLYKILDIDTSEAIAIQEDAGTYVKAVAN
ncbi:hypothetical protein BVG16_24425 [Paenibacillus selenitireducens]|uniref:Uncharacterized protein n=1 Tax=Paenibacillus selenitireducens TaxID=1324314 RepID=A0A1T2X382_9BACL|nr:hypothetical protein [Paenibacillus selenitireducens]OPA74275.1 hypothetical protein BVG16_24425 [Paenibacillus selenitireducens]